MSWDFFCELAAAEETDEILGCVSLKGFFRYVYLYRSFCLFVNGSRLIILEESKDEGAWSEVSLCSLKSSCFFDTFIA